MKEMAAAANANARDIKLITRANREQSVTAGELAKQLGDIRRLAEQNVDGVTRTRGGTASLQKQAETLALIMGEAFPKATKNGANGRGR